MGDPFDYTQADSAGAGYRLLRGVERGRHPHDGADLGNGSAGGVVRAASHGLVIRVAPDLPGNGYGRHVVIAHRLADGGLVYSVYAHLGPAGPSPEEGARVRAGEPIGRVGRSGRATTDHLHFEVRRPRDPGDRWERAVVLDPLAFVAARLPAGVGSDWDAPLVVWGAAGGLIDEASAPADPLRRVTWWRMLWRSARAPLERMPESPRALRDSLIDAGVLGAEASRERPGVVTWDELARDLERLRGLGLRLPDGPLAPQACRALCERELGAGDPARHPERLAGLPSRPTVAQALLALADLAQAGAREP